ncbi:hypothetical protein HOA59_00730 [archaeon]|jgi:hypothetical protein|nr:hypothetical protein [archaeon]MBT6823944.1 hypothetical protein [archaeon]MBT7107174.1 hypothetical protein [archaeon]MBT7297756.1 hypothetical protein [archaeon]
MKDLSDKINELKKELSIFDTSKIGLVKYLDRTYWIDPTSYSGEGEIAEWFASTTYDGADIYIHDNAIDEFKKPYILHEIVESSLVRDGLSTHAAHLVAKHFDGEYAKEILSDSKYEEYETLRLKLEK